MKSLLKNLGIILIVLAALILMIAFFTGNVNNNTVLGGTLCLGVVGLICYIVLNKRITE